MEKDKKLRTNERREFRKIAILILILGTIIDTLAIILALQIELGFLFLLIPGTCYMVNSSIILILDQPKYWLQSDPEVEPINDGKMSV